MLLPHVFANIHVFFQPDEFGPHLVLRHLIDFVAVDNQFVPIWAFNALIGFLSGGFSPFD